MSQEELSANLSDWSEIIKKQAAEMRARSQLERDQAQTRANTLEPLPLEDIFTQEALGTPVVPAYLREMLEQAGQGGSYESSPSPLITALIHAAAYWHQVAQE